MLTKLELDKMVENPGLVAFPHSLGSALIKAEDKGKLKSRALSAMHEQTAKQLLQIQKQVELLVNQANELKKRVEISERIYLAELSFEPFVGNDYHLYETEEGVHKLFMIAPEEWGRSKPDKLNFVASVKLLSDHTWEVLK